MAPPVAAVVLTAVVFDLDVAIVLGVVASATRGDDRGGRGGRAVLPAVLPPVLAAAVHGLAHELRVDLRRRGGGLRRGRLGRPGVTRGEGGGGEYPEGDDRDRCGDVVACDLHGRHPER